MYQNDAQKVLTGEVRCSYVNVHTPRQINGQGKPKYSLTLLIPKTDTNTINDIRASMQAAIDAGMTGPKNIWGGVRPPKIATTLYDGDGEKPEGGPWGAECKGHYVLRASSDENHKPEVVGMDNIKVQLDPANRCLEARQRRRPTSPGLERIRVRRWRLHGRGRGRSTP